MGKHYLVFLCLLRIFCFPLLHSYLALAAGTDDGSEQWGYVEVRPKAHLFWWHYKSPHRVEDPTKPWPIILWLQGGPGGSGVAFGNFIEIGPLDGSVNPRNSTWLLKADLLFVDSPVATGFSYVEDEVLVVSSDEEAAADLTALLKELFNGKETLQKSPLYIFAESYGGKFAATLGVSALKAIEAGELKLQLGGVALGDSWISPEDFVDFYNFLLDYVNDPVIGSTTQESKGFVAADSYSRCIHHQGALEWDGQGGLVFQALVGDFMKPRIQEVPVEQPCVSLQMVGNVTKSPNNF
ncbi:hypothetical protein POTOM_025395 [Populus tomentosa]|uniref:Carboxypeptidase n=1 Tax=Populus tomentosa TaxID=118781 RepID=A0A8X8CWZ2_POPTO|nr:hypothetical protein POTOM_025395 [Populus tomentosa]